jgi:hypothetical protein
MSPLYVMYDLRVAYSHLASEAGQEKQLDTIRQRLGLASDSGFFAIYDALVPALKHGFDLLSKSISSTPP